MLSGKHDRGLGSGPNDLRVLVISDGKAGHEAQARGVAEALGGDIQVMQVHPSGMRSVLAPWGRAAVGCRPEPPWPDIAIAAGRLSMPSLRYLKGAAGIVTYRVALQDPRTGSGLADLIWVPQHDKRRGANVITTLTSPHPYSKVRLEELRADPLPAISALPLPRIGLIIGGPNKVYSYGAGDIDRLVEQVRRIGASGAGLMITPSRRTPAALLDAVDHATRTCDRIFWRGEGANPYPQFLANADAFIVTSDSVSMTGEACATGRPVHVFKPTGGSAKFERFHQALMARGATRLLGDDGLQSWSYEPLQAAGVIADEIMRRYRARKAMMPGLMQG